MAAPVHKPESSAERGISQKQDLSLQHHIERNRVNQRNFRARRQGYVRELEQRLHKFESDRLQVAMEIQAAARVVHEENLKLKFLLEQRFGVTKTQLDAYLAELHGGSNTVAQRTREANDTRASPNESPKISQTLQPVEASEPVTRESGLPAPHLCPKCKTASGPILQGVPKTVPTAANFSSDLDGPHDEENHSLDHPLDQFPGTDSGGLGQAENGPSAGPDRSCEEAAQIIASLRGHDQSTDVLNELGCSTSSCRVANLSIFQLMDQSLSS